MQSKHKLGRSPVKTHTPLITRASKNTFLFSSSESPTPSPFFAFTSLRQPQTSLPRLVSSLPHPKKTLEKRRRRDMAEVEVPAAAVATTTPEAAATEGGAATEAKGPHKLHRQWTFWYDIQSKPKPGAAWGTSLKKAYTFDTVEDFWRYVGAAADMPSFMPRLPA